MGYPKPKGYVGSGSDGDIIRTGTGGRLSNKTNPDEYTGTDGRRNPQDLDTLPGDNFL